jgi:hypothetical protein
LRSVERPDRPAGSTSFTQTFAMELRKERPEPVPPRARFRA